MVKYVDPNLIKKELTKIVKNTNFYYSKAKKSRIKDRKQHDLNKKTKELKKKLAKLKTFKRPDIFGIKERILNR